MMNTLEICLFLYLFAVLSTLFGSREEYKSRYKLHKRENGAVKMEP